MSRSRIHHCVAFFVLFLHIAAGQMKGWVEFSDAAPSNGTEAAPWPLTASCPTPHQVIAHSLNDTSSKHYYWVNISGGNCNGAKPLYIDLLMKRTSDIGDPDLYVTSCPSEYMGTNASECVGSFGRDTTTAAEHAVSDRLVWGEAEQFKVLLVEVRKWGTSDTTYQIGAVLSQCMNNVAWTGATLSDNLCGGSDHGTCQTATGTCQCSVPAGTVGFKYVEEDCTGLQFPPLPLNMSTQIVIKHCIDNFVSFPVSNDTFELTVDVLATENVNPLLLIGGYDGQVKYVPRTTTTGNSTQMVLSRADIGEDSQLDAFGNYTIRLNVKDPEHCSHTTQVNVLVSEFACPQNCTGQGVCNASAHTCTCNQGWSGRTCNVPLSEAQPDRLYWNEDGTQAPLVKGSGFNQTFQLEQDESITFKMNISVAPVLSTLSVNVTAIGNPPNSWCPSYPVVSVARKAPSDSIVPSNLNCGHHQSQRSTELNLCGVEFNDQPDGSGTGEWFLTVAAAGFTKMEFKIDAVVIESKMAPTLTKLQSELKSCQQTEAAEAANLAKTQQALNHCENEGHGGKTKTKGVSNGIAALLFFIGLMVGGAGGWATTRFFCFPKGIGFSTLQSAPSSSAGYNNAMSFAKTDGGNSLLQDTDTTPRSNSNL